MIQNFINSLEIMYKGMFGIFSVIIIISLIVVLIQKLEHILTTKKENDQE